MNGARSSRAKSSRPASRNRARNDPSPRKPSPILSNRSSMTFPTNSIAKSPMAPSARVSWMVCAHSIRWLMCATRVFIGGSTKRPTLCRKSKNWKNLMILLRPDCLVFETPSGENVPCAVKEVTIEFVGEAAGLLEQETLENAAAAVLHFFRVEQQRESITVAEFSAALEQVLGSLGLKVKPEPASSEAPSITRRLIETDLCLLAGDGGELFFFPRLRDEIRKRRDGPPFVL